MRPSPPNRKPQRLLPAAGGSSAAPKPKKQIPGDEIPALGVSSFSSFAFLAWLVWQVRTRRRTDASAGSFPGRSSAFTRQWSPSLQRRGSGVCAPNLRSLPRSGVACSLGIGSASRGCQIAYGAWADTEGRNVRPAELKPRRGLPRERGTPTVVPHPSMYSLAGSPPCLVVWAARR